MGSQFRNPSWIHSQLAAARWHLKVANSASPAVLGIHLELARQACDGVLLALPTAKIAGRRRLWIEQELARMQSKVEAAAGRLSGPEAPPGSRARALGSD
jgi:hypothetical protein